MKIHAFLIVASCCVVFAESPEVNSNEPWLTPVTTVHTSTGLNVTIFESKKVSEGPGIGPYFFSPSAILHTSSAKHEFNSITGRDEVRFYVDLWTQEYVAEISSLTGIPGIGLSLYPFDSVKLVLNPPGSGLDPKKYPLPESQPISSLTSPTLRFAIPCKGEKACSRLVARIKGCPSGSDKELPELGFHLEFRNSSLAMSMARPVPVTKNDVESGLFKMIPKNDTDGQLILTGAALDQFVDEVARSLLTAESRKRANATVEFVQLDEALNAIKKRLVDGKVSPSSVKDWRTVITADSEKFHRSRHLKRHGSGVLTNREWKEWHTVPEKHNVNSTEHRRHPSNQTSTDLFIVNAAKLISNDNLVNVELMVFPTEAIIYFPVVIPRGSSDDSEIAPLTLFLIHFSWIMMLILVVGGLSTWYRFHRKRRSGQ